MREQNEFCDTLKSCILYQNEGAKLNLVQCTFFNDNNISDSITITLDNYQELNGDMNKKPLFINRLETADMNINIFELDFFNDNDKDIEFGQKMKQFEESLYL